MTDPTIPPNYEAATATAPQEGGAELYPPTNTQPTFVDSTGDNSDGAGMCQPQQLYPACGAPPPMEKESEIRTAATNISIPNWESRLEACVGHKITLNIPFDSILSTFPDSKSRVKALQTLLTGTQGVVNQGMAAVKMETQMSAVELLVRAFETSTEDDAVRDDIAAKVHKIDFFTQPLGSVPQSKTFSFVEGGIAYNAVLSGGGSGIFNKKELHALFEREFYAEERALVTKFVYFGLPEAEARIEAAMGKKVEIDFDIIKMLGACTTQEDRLPSARTIITRTKLSAKAEVSAKRALTSLAIAATALANKAQDKPPPEEPEKMPHNSPNVLIPLVEAIEFCCKQHETVRQSIAAAISKIHFGLIPGQNLVGTLNLHQAIELPVVPPSAVGTPPIENGSLVYHGCFEAGSKGCFTKSDIVDFFEAHFRCREKGYVHALMSSTVPTANARLSEAMGRPFEIEVAWTTIFNDALTMKQRLDVAETLCGQNSRFVIQPMVQGICTVVKKFDEAQFPAMEQDAGPPENPIKTRVHRVVIKGIPGSGAKPSLVLTALAQGTDMRSALTYTCGLERGTHGCYDVTDFKETLRKMFGIATPRDEGGIYAAMGKADATISKLGNDVGKKLSKMKFW